MNPAKADAEALLNALMPIAEQMLTKYREFYPYGGRMAHDGKIALASAYNGTEHPLSQPLIDLLTNAHRSEAKENKLRACAIIYDIRTIPPGKSEKQDAIAVACDHVSGYSVVVIFPYSFDAEKKLQVEAPFATEGSYSIFGRPNEKA